MERYNCVRLETLRDKSGRTVSQRFDHPASITVEQMKRILASVQIEQPRTPISKLLLQDKPAAEQAFNAKEIGYLATPFATALEAATPDERVTFFLDHKRGLLRGSTSSGVAFVKDSRVNLILGRYRMGKQPGQEDINVGGNPLPQTNEQKFYIVPGSYQELVGEKTAPGTGDAVYENRWVAIRYKELLDSPIEAPEASPTVTAPAETTSRQIRSKTTSETLEEKLRTLKRLRQEELITEDEYKQKKQELLRSF